MKAKSGVFLGKWKMANNVVVGLRRFQTNEVVSIDHPVYIILKLKRKSLKIKLIPSL